MAHLPEEALPSDFDVVIEGTGLIQSLLAAALSRCGKTVLHLDSNPYYGEQWGTLMYRELRGWISSHQELPRGEAAPNLDDAPPQGQVGVAEIKPGETVVEIKPPLKHNITNLTEAIYGTEAEDEGVDKKDDQPTDEEAEEQKEPTPPQANKPAPVTWNSLGEQRKFFNFDIMPKLLLARGSIVDLLTTSTVSKYLEFRATAAILQCSDGQLGQVPCSRTDLFSTKAVSLLDKRKMMKFLQFCAEYEQHPQQYEAFKGKPFGEFLTAQGLTPLLMRYVLHSIAMQSGEVPTEEGLKATHSFLHSLGRFGNTPFLYPVYGCGELPQAFCRFCAVFGGVYVLRRSIASVIRDENNSVAGIVCSAGQRINCRMVVLPIASAHNTFDLGKAVCTMRCSRGIVVSDGPLCADQASHVNVITVPPNSISDQQQCNVIGIELDSSTSNTVAGTYVCHWTCPSVTATAQEDLQCVVEHFYSTTPPVTASAGADAVTPRALWSLFYNMELCSVDQEILAGTPANLYITSDPANKIIYDEAVAEAKLLFKKICPDEENFMPSPPDPEDIIFEEEVAHEVGEAEDRDGAGESEIDKAPGTDAVQSDQTLDKEETELVKEKEAVNDT